LWRPAIFLRRGRVSCHEALNKVSGYNRTGGRPGFQSLLSGRRKHGHEHLIDNVLTPSLLGDRKVNCGEETPPSSLLAKIWPGLFDKIRTGIDENPAKAAKYFLTFLKIAGFTLEDLQGSGWQKITDDDWSAIVKGDSAKTVRNGCHAFWKSVRRPV